MAESEICLREEGSVLLVHPDYKGRVTVDWFRPGFWGAKAQPVSSGGRGGAWFIDTGTGQVVLREYRRGGLVARISEQSYVFTREQDVRSFAEFRLLNRLVGMGLPVPTPVAAWYRKGSVFLYQAAIIIERLADTTPLADLIPTLDVADWEVLGGTVRRFHDAGVRHADLNCFNVLVRDGTYFLIDFDKGRIMPGQAPEKWKASNLERFARSIRKVAGKSALDRVWDSFMNGYNGSQTS
ncbi:3-deoxy-D-manno-octulosonic acid kinase [Marinobacter sp. DUT-1]|uniref:3-deoxy-D-manno-octulosonic acid kinase n=1 Tax=Marinobacter sp. DUT-1 TaxID=3412037 RepID=UPI003D168E31